MTYTEKCRADALRLLSCDLFETPEAAAEAVPLGPPEGLGDDPPAVYYVFLSTSMLRIAGEIVRHAAVRLGVEPDELWNDIAQELW